VTGGVDGRRGSLRGARAAPLIRGGRTIKPDRLATGWGVHLKGAAKPPGARPVGGAGLLPDGVTFANALTTFWIALVIGVLALWVARPDLFTPESVEAALLACGPWAFAGFVAVSLVRGAFLIPSTPVVLAGGALFPDAAVAVLLVSMAGILLTAAVLYRFPGFAGYDARLAARYPEKLARLQRHLAKPQAPAFVALWAFFPVVPTDLICYAAGLVRMPFRRLMLGIVVGELPLVAAYVFVGKRVAEWLTL
jgi:uncharacterized membrane protein YdjX (TVP38/TMEM64 family)